MVARHACAEPGAIARWTATLDALQGASPVVSPVWKGASACNAISLVCWTASSARTAGNSPIISASAAQRARSDSCKPPPGRPMPSGTGALRAGARLHHRPSRGRGERHPDCRRDRISEERHEVVWRGPPIYRHGRRYGYLSGWVISRTCADARGGFHRLLAVFAVRMGQGSGSSR